MCRYAAVIYKSHFACFSCRKAFKKTPIDEYLKHAGLGAVYEEIVAVYSSTPRRRAVEAKFGVSYEQLMIATLPTFPSVLSVNNRWLRWGWTSGRLRSVTSKRGASFKNCMSMALHSKAAGAAWDTRRRRARARSPSGLKVTPGKQRARNYLRQSDARKHSPCVAAATLENQIQFTTFFVAA